MSGQPFCACCRGRGGIGCGLLFRETANCRAEPDYAPRRCFSRQFLECPQRSISVKLGARKCFPQMPDELFNMWIKPEIESRGWPFGGDEAIVSDPAWAKYLRNLGPHFWRGVRWRRVSQAFITVPLEERAKNIGRMLAEVGREFQETGIAKSTLVKNSPQKVAALAEVTSSCGQLPKPLVCLVQGQEWWLMDGHHRLGALFMLGDQNSIPFDCWVGEYGRSEEGPAA